MSPWRLLAPQVATRTDDPLPRHLMWFRLGMLAWMFFVSLAVAIALAVTFAHLDDVQASRLANCRAQNDRHDATVRTLNEDIAAIVARTPAAHRAATRARLEASKVFTLGLIDSLQPRVDCSSKVRD